MEGRGAVGSDARMNWAVAWIATAAVESRLFCQVQSDSMCTEPDNFGYRKHY